MSAPLRLLTAPAIVLAGKTAFVKTSMAPCASATFCAGVYALVKF
jgi:hypothetical protein